MSIPRRVIDRPTLVSVAVLCTWLAMIGYLILSGKYAYYLHPKYMFIPVFGLLVLAGMAFVLLRDSRQPEAELIPTPEGELIDPRKQVSEPLQRLALLLLPPFFLVTLGVQSLEGGRSLSGLQSYSGVTSGSMGSMSPPSAVESPGPAGTEDEEYPEITYVDLQWGRGAERVGKGVSAVGMFFTDARMPEGMFGLARLLITCCAADARPVALLVSGDGSALRREQWARVFGTLRKGEKDGKPFWYIEASRVLPATAPDPPYLY